MMQQLRFAFTENFSKNFAATLEETVEYTIYERSREAQVKKKLRGVLGNMHDVRFYSFPFQAIHFQKLSTSNRTFALMQILYKN